ncbi:heterokaryon incompatibility protein-domain-containing protein, partial [Diaporthe sp. PMI_573]
MDQYEYAPLTEPDGMRLLLLLPAADRAAELCGSLLQTSIAVCSFDILSCYTALSYVWGDPAPIETIILDGTRVNITANLATALRDIRDPDRTHRIWADALCIDQADISERNQQVPLMGRIYSCARSTIIYLGHESEAVKCLFAGDPAPQNPEALLEDIVGRPWFTRTWVFQELVLSADPWIQLGRQRIRWRELCKLLLPLVPDSSARSLGDGLQASRKRVLREMETVRCNVSDRTLLKILDLRAGCRASDPRDVVFAHMGMITDEEEVSKYLKVDYRASIRHVYLSTARYALASFGLAVTARSIKRPQGLAHLPSWVPDW